jgi:hypothetical protein
VDNDHYKSHAGEEDSMLLVPHWEQCPGKETMYGFWGLTVVQLSHHKSAAGEQDSMLLVPHWQQCPG